jgi:hypothetical protein
VSDLERIEDVEVVDAELVSDFQGIRLEQWFAAERDMQYIKLTITNQWMARHQDAAWRELSVILEALREFVNNNKGEVKYEL